MASASAQYLATLHQQVDQYFSFSDVKELCFQLGVDDENIPGDIRSAFIRNLIVSLAKQSRLQELVTMVRRERPRVTWQDVPADFELPASVAQENLQQVVNYHVYSGDVVQGDKVGGDKISVGNISNAQGLAIGRDSAATVQQTPQPVAAERPSPTPISPASNNPTVQQTIDRLNRYLQMASDGQKDAAAELLNAIQLVLNITQQPPVDPLLLKLLCLGQLQLAQNLSSDIPGIEQVVAQFVTAVQQK